MSNDTSAAVGYYPLSPTERAFMGMERFLNGREFKERFPQTGEDVKVMGVRMGRDLCMIVAMPLLAGHVTSEQDYFAGKAAILKEMRDVAAGTTVSGGSSYNTTPLTSRDGGWAGFI